MSAVEGVCQAGGGSVGLGRVSGSSRVESGQAGSSSAQVSGRAGSGQPGRVGPGLEREKAGSVRVHFRVKILTSGSELWKKMDPLSGRISYTSSAPRHVVEHGDGVCLLFSRKAESPPSRKAKQAVKKRCFQRIPATKTHPCGNDCTDRCLLP